MGLWRNSRQTRWGWMVAACCAVLTGAAALLHPEHARAGSAVNLCPPYIPKNTAFYLKTCCPKPCPVFDKSLYETNQKELELLQKWAQLTGLKSISVQLLLEGAGQRIAALPLVESPLSSYNILEQASMRECLSTPDELVENNLLTPYTNPPESIENFTRRAWAFSLSNVTENAPLHLSSVPERVNRKFCRAWLQNNYALEQLSVAMSAQSTLRAFKAKLYEYIRLSAASSTASCAPKTNISQAASSTPLQGYLSNVQKQLGDALGSANPVQLPDLPGCLRQDIFLNTQLRTDQVLLKTYVDQMRTLYNMGEVFSNLPGGVEFGVGY
jgi:hypothetical protein